MAVKLRGTIKSAGLLLFSQLLLSIAGPIVNLLVVRYLGPNDFGYYASALAVTSFIGLLADFGINQATLKYGSLGDDELRAAFYTGLKVAMTLAAVAYAITLFWFYTLKYEAIIIQLGQLFAIRYFVTAFIAPCMAILQTKGAYRRLALLGIETSVSNWMTTLILLLLGANLKLLVGLPVMVYAIITFYCFYRAIRHWLEKDKQEVRCSLKDYLYDALVFGLGGTFYRIYNQSDSALLSAMRSSLEVGFYQVAFGVISLVYVVPSIVFNQVLYPKYFKLSRTDREYYKLLYILTSKIMLVMGCSLCLGIWAIGDVVMILLFGDAYTPSIIYLLILALAIPLHYWASAVGSVLTTDNLAGLKVKMQGLVAFVSLTLNLMFIPAYGALCTALTTVICELLLVLSYLWVVNASSISINIWRDLKLYYFILIITGGAICRFYNIISHVVWVRSTILIALVVVLLIYLVSPFYLTDKEKRELLVSSKRS